jgi:hypothetical protein
VIHQLPKEPVPLDSGVAVQAGCVEAVKFVLKVTATDVLELVDTLPLVSLFAACVSI